MSEYSFFLPPDFDDYEWEVTAKGFFSEGKIVCLGKTYSINFYDRARLGQEIEDEIQRDGAFSESNLVVVQSVTRLVMNQAAELLIRSDRLSSLAPD